ncbi:MAG: hypothetical protein EWV77_17650 [Microcystis viridis Mv_BB_P_19951000_S68D]|uniref:Uncharacterized protein n=1 Tax=Microcystis viridis Mv_BB_P_19951000_S68D TaxID=2486270 RepID=A0A552HFC5_MICVR|nr:MAG: hypothetical protein EWV77_17650 [Microcystis viridis Mv_BB_P_19951000_S68D]
MSFSPESIRNTSVSDQATNNDVLGFEPYVIAIAEFLLHQQTQPPLIPFFFIIAPMVGAHRVRPKCHLDISTKLRCTRHNHLCHYF